MKTDVEKWIYLWISLLCAIMRDGCAVIPSEQSLRSIQKYRLRDLYALRTVSGRLKPNDPTLYILSELGLWHYRSRRMGQRCSKQIRAIGRPVYDWDISCSDRSRPVRSRRKVSAVRGKNVNYLIYPAIARHAVQPLQELRCGTLNVCSARNKIEGIDTLVRDLKLDILSLCETWHEDSDCITIGRLRALN